MKCYLMDHRGGLKEACETIKEIPWSQFDDIVSHYTPYGYDDRINCFRFILNDIPNNFKDYCVWLLIGDFSYGNYHFDD